MSEPRSIHQGMFRVSWRGFLLLSVLLIVSIGSPAYSVLTHEEIIDLLWKSDIEPMLRARFPAATAEDLRRAHAFAYGGCVIQDVGYYPFGNKEFSDLTHYVRSGDFVDALFAEATTLDEYAFAIGALAHYTADITGHPAINHSVALRFPKLRAKYGEQVTYADSPTAHIRTEFGFDVAQVAKHRYAPDSYHDFIGFEVAKDSLSRAFRRTYGFDIGELFTNYDLSIGTYRRSVSKIIPEMTKAALLTHNAELKRELSNADQKKFLYNLSRAAYEKEWGRDYRRPGAGARMLAFLFRLVPKAGPFKAVAFETPNAQTEDLYFKSVNTTVDRYRDYLHRLQAGGIRLADIDCDTGKKTIPGEYDLTDRAHSKLLHRLATHRFEGVDDPLRAKLLAFYADPNAPDSVKKNKSDWQQTQRDLEQLRTATPNAVSVAGH